MFLVPLAAAAIAVVFAAMLAKEFAAKRRPYTLLWAIALVCYAIASAMVTLGVLGGGGWSEREYAIYWGLGAVLNVPFLAGGEIVLLFRQPWVRWGTWLVLVFSVAYTTAVLRAAEMDPAALADRLPSGKDVFGAGTAAQHLPQVFSYPAYVILVAGALWSAWRMRGHPELRDRFIGTLLIAVGATIVAAGATFAALGMLVGFILTLVVGIAVMFGGFLRAGRRSVVPAAA
jgi:hypothetical protein